MTKHLKYTKDDIEQMIVDRLNGELSESKTRLLKTIVARDPDAFQLWQEHKAIKNYTRARRLERTVDIETEWKKFQDKIQSLPQRSLWIRRYAVVASLFFALGVGILVYRLANIKTEGLDRVVKTEGQVSLMLDNGKTIIIEDRRRLEFDHLLFEDGQFVSTTPDEPDSAHITIRVPKGKIFQFSLEDGTKVALNSGSTFRFPVSFGSDERRVSLDGEAYFEVAKKEGKDFKVRANGMGIRVLGTKFNVRSYPHMPFITSLLEGSVQVNDDDLKSVFKLKPGYEVVKNDAHIQTRKIENKHVIKWIDGLNYFDNRPLSEIVDMITLSTGYDIRVSDDQVGRLRFSGAFQRQDSLSTLLRLFSETSSVKYRVEEGHIVLY